MAELHLRQFHEVQSIVDQYGATFASIRPPHIIYEEERARLRRQISEALARLRTAQPGDESSREEETVIDLSGHMRDLEHHYKANSDRYAREHETRLKNTMETFRDELGELLGLSRAAQIQMLSNDGTQTQVARSDKARQEPAENASHRPQHARKETAMDQPVEGEFTNNEALEATPVPQGVDNQGPIFDDEDDHPIENGVNDGDKGNSDESADMESDNGKAMENDTTPTVRNLRSGPTVSTPSDSTTVGPGTVSRLRASGATNAPPTPSPSEERSQTKRKALTPASSMNKRQRNGSDISKKLDRDVPRAESEAQETSRQSTAAVSRNTTREPSNKPSAMRSNTSVAESSSRAPPRRSHRHIDESADGEEFEGILHPKPGNVYVTFWKKTKEWLAVVLLPMGDFSSIGIEGSIVSCQLAESLPSCYNKMPKRGKYVWARGYRNGESLEKERMFPVMYFDGRPFPSKSAIMWIGARDLRVFDPKLQHALVPHIRTVRKYLKSRGWSDEEVADKEQSRPGSEAQEAQAPGTSPETDNEELQVAQAPEEDVDMPDETTAEPENLEPQNPRKQLNRDRGEDVPPDDPQIPESRPETPSEEPTPQAETLPQFGLQPRSQPQAGEESQPLPEPSTQPQLQTQRQSQRDFSSLFWSTVTTEQRRLPSVPAGLRLDQQQNPHSVPLSTLLPPKYVRRPQSPTASSQCELPTSPHPVEDPPTEPTKEPSAEETPVGRREVKPWIKGESFVILDSDSEDEDEKSPSQAGVPSGMGRSALSDSLTSNSRSDQRAAQREHQTFNARTGGGSQTPVQILNADQSISGAAAENSDHTTEHDYRSRRESHTSSRFQPRPASVRAPSSQNSPLLMPRTTKSTSAPRQSTSYPRAQEQLSDLRHELRHQLDGGQTASTSQSHHSQWWSQQHPSPRQYAALPPERQLSSYHQTREFNTLPSQAVHGPSQHTQSSQPLSYQQYENGAHNDRSQQAFNNRFHAGPMPSTTYAQTHYPRPIDQDTTQHSPAQDSGLRTVTEVGQSDQHLPQGSLSLPSANHSSYTWPSSVGQAQHRPESFTPTSYHHHQQPGSAVTQRSTDSYGDANASNANHIDPHVRTATGTVQEALEEQEQRPTYGEPPALPSVRLSYGTQDQSGLGYGSQYRRDSQDGFTDAQDRQSFSSRPNFPQNRSLLNPQEDSWDEQVYTQRGHLHPGHPCFHEPAYIPPTSTRPYSQIHSSYFPDGLSRYLSELASAKGLQPGLSGFESATESGYWCPFCEAWPTNGTFATNAQRTAQFKRPWNFQQHLIKHWRRAGLPRQEDKDEGGR